MKAKVIVVSILAFVLVVSGVVLFLVRPNRNQTYEPASKEELIEAFHDNYELFIAVAKFAKSTEGNLYVFYNRWNGDKRIENTGNESEIDNMSVEAKKGINKILKRLKFSGIYEYEPEEICFVRDSGEFEQGICYLGNNEKPFYFEELELIKDGWYYYTAYHV